jgi:hypothetical protein
MPHQIAIKSERRLVAIRFWGSLTRADFDRARAALKDDRSFDPSLDAVIDLREADMRRISLADVESIAEQSLLQSTARRAILADRSDQLGLARLYSMLRGMTGQETTRVFWELQEAAAWLNLDGFDLAGLLASGPIGRETSR